jgi:hypothetical protein
MVVQQGEGGWREIVASHKAFTSESMSEAPRIAMP